MVRKTLFLEKNENTLFKKYIPRIFALLFNSTFTKSI